MKNLKKNHHKEKGSITIFLSIIFFVMVSFVLVLIDATRINVAKNQIVIASDNAAESAMANFNGTLFDEYGFFAYDNNNSQSLAQKIFDLNMKSPNGKAGLLNLKGNATITSMTPLYSDNNEFKRQMIYAMKYQGTENLALGVIDKINQFIEVAEAASINEDIEEINDLMEKDENELQKQLEKIEKGKLDAQRLIISLTLCNYEPGFYIIDKYDKATHFDSQIGSNSLLKLVNDNIGKVFFDYIEDDGKNRDFVENPLYQNIYTYKYAEHLVRCYKRTFEKEYEDANTNYTADTTKYQSDLTAYNEWSTYETEHAKWETEHAKWEEKKKENPNLTDEEPKEPSQPTSPKVTSKPAEVEKPEILKLNLEKVKKELQDFCNKLNAIAEKSAKDLVDDENQKIGFFIKSVDEGMNAIETFLNSGKRTELEDKVKELERKLNSSSISADEKVQIKELIKNYKDIVNEDILNDTKRTLSDIKSVGNKFKSNLYSSNDIIDKINSKINSSPLKIEESKDIVGPLVDKIFKGVYSYKDSQNGTYKESAEFDVNNENKVKEFIKDNFPKNNKYKEVNELKEFRKIFLNIHKDCEIIDNLTGENIKVERIDIGEKDEKDEDLDDSLKKLVGDKKIEIDGTLQEILDALDSTAKIEETFFGGSGENEDKATEDFQKISGYKNYQYNQSLLDKIYLMEYIMTNFKDMADYKEGTKRIPEKTEHDSVLEYEIEAIVRSNGCYDDKENKEAMVKWIKVIRTACNMVTILKTKKMMKFTLRVSEIICKILAAACSFIPYIGGAIAKVVSSKGFQKIVQYGLIIAWATNEANLDTADLLRGYYVPIIKDAKKEWLLNYGLDLSDANDIGYDEIKNVKNNFKEPDREEGEPFNKQPETEGNKLKMANYPDYLRIRLLSKLLFNEDSVINSVKEISNANMVKVTDSGFKYSDYYTAMKISVDSSVSTWFKTEAFGSNGKVKFNNYSYIKRYN